MPNEIYVTVENVRKSKLLALFSTLKERDKDIVITMTESLVKQYKNNEMYFVEYFVTEGIKYGYSSS